MKHDNCDVLPKQVNQTLFIKHIHLESLFNSIGAQDILYLYLIFAGPNNNNK